MLSFFQKEGLPFARWALGLPREVIFNLQIRLIYLFIYFFPTSPPVEFGTEIDWLAKNFNFTFAICL